MFRAIWVSTGKSCKAMLIHCALHPVAAIAIASTRARKAFDLELVFIGFSIGKLLKHFVFGRSSLVVGLDHTGGERRKTKDQRPKTKDQRPKTKDQRPTTLL